MHVVSANDQFVKEVLSDVAVQVTIVHFTIHLKINELLKKNIKLVKRSVKFHKVCNIQYHLLRV